MKKLLIIGGTQFVGRNLIEALIKIQKYDLTLFNRGVTNPTLFPKIKKIKGDRKNENDLEKICSKDWDCVIDISGYWPNALEKQFKIQTGKIGKYIFISTSSHYQFDLERPHLIKEEEGLVPCSLEQREGEKTTFYNEKKAECERILERQNNLNYVILRPGLIIGKHDHTDRLYYWFYKIKNQPEVLVANEAKNIVSYTVVHDLARAIIHSIEAKNNFKVYNIASFNKSIADFIFLIKKELKKEVELVSASAGFLGKHGVKQWVGLPLWFDVDILMIDSSRIEKDYDFTFTKIEKATKDLLEYYGKIKKWEPPFENSNQLKEEKEKKLIKLLRSNEKDGTQN